MKKFKKGLLLAIASLSIGAMSGCDFLKKDSGNEGSEEQQTPAEETVAVSSVTLDKKTLDLYVTGSTYLRATIAPENATNKYLTWSSSNEDVAIVTATGKVTALSAGEADIKVESQADPTKSDTCHVTVTIKDDTVHVTGVTLDKQSADLYVGEKLNLVATVLPADATNKGVSFSSSNKDVAFVDASGSVVAVSDGDAVITASSNENSSISASCTVHVTTKDTTVHVTGLEVSKTELTLDLGGIAGPTSEKVVATISPENATNKAVVWSSADPSKVVADSQGNIVAVSVTSEPVIVTVASDENNAISKTVSVTVVDNTDHSVHVTGVELPENLGIDLKSASSATLTATVAPPNAGNKLINWSSSDPSVVSIGSSIGETSVTLNALKKGTATITATSQDGGFSDTCLVTIDDTRNPVTGVVISPKENLETTITDLDIRLGSFAQVVASVLPGDADNKGILWSMEEEAKEYISLSATSGSDLTIFANKATPEDKYFVLTATSAENAAFKATLNVTVTDPTIYADGIEIGVEGLVGEQTQASVEHTRQIKLEANVYSAKGVVTNPEVEWIVPTNDKLITTENIDNTLTVYGKNITEEDSPIVITARVKAQPEISSEISIKVINPTTMDRFTGFADPSDYAAYKGHIAKDNLVDASTVQTRTTFSDDFYAYDSENAEKYLYKVGDQGAFHFAPIAYVKRVGQEKSEAVSNISLVKKLILIDGENETDVTDSMSSYLDFDSLGNDYTFKDPALNNTFRLEFILNDSNYYVPQGIDTSYEFTFKVIHGYNVDNLAELSLFDNVQSEWQTFKNQNELTSAAEGGIILHKDIKIDEKIIPDQFKLSEADYNNHYTQFTSDFEYWAHQYFCRDKEGATEEEKRAAAREAFIGSPRDYTTLFLRSTKTEDFSFEGNFFNIDCSDLKPVYLLDPNDGDLPKTLMNGMAGDGSHAQVFGINTDHNTVPQKHSVEMRNFSLKGNGGLDPIKGTNILDDLKKGGLIAFKFSNAKFDIENAIVQSSFVSFMSEGYTSNFEASGEDFMELNADRVTSYNSYSNMFYLFGSQHNKVSNSWMSRSGGPLILMDEPFGHDWYKDSVRAVGMECKDCYLKNEVMGTEPWFQGHEGSNLLASQFIIDIGLPGGAYYSSATGEGARTIARSENETTSYCDLIAVDVYANNFIGNETHNLRGSFIVTDSEDSVGLDMSKVARKGDGTVDAVSPYVRAAVQAGMGVDTNMIPYLFSPSEGSLGLFCDTFVYNAGTDMLGTTDLYTHKYTCGYLNPYYLTDPTEVQGRYIGLFLGTYAK